MIVIVVFLLAALVGALAAIGLLARAILAKVNRIMDEQTLQQRLDAIRDGITTVADKLAAQTATIAGLKAQLAAGTPVTQEQLDALGAEADAIVSTLEPLTSPAPTADAATV